MLRVCVPFHYDYGPNLNTVCYGIVPVAATFSGKKMKRANSHIAHMHTAYGMENAKTL